MKDGVISIRNQSIAIILKGFSQKAHCQGKMKKVNEIYSGTDSGRAAKN